MWRIFAVSSVSRSFTILSSSRFSAASRTCAIQPRSCACLGAAAPAHFQMLITRVRTLNTSSRATYSGWLKNPSVSVLNAAEFDLAMLLAAPAPALERRLRVVGVAHGSGSGRRFRMACTHESVTTAGRTSLTSMHCCDMRTFRSVSIASRCSAMASIRAARSAKA